MNIHLIKYILLVVFKIFGVSDIGLVIGIDISDDISDESMSEQCVIEFSVSNETEDEFCCVGINPQETVLCFEDISVLLDNVLIVL